MNALHLAAVGGHLQIVKYLMPKFGDSRFDLDNLGQNCLHKAVKEGHPKVVRYLIEEGGFDPNLRDKVKYIFFTCILCASCQHATLYRMIWTAFFWPAIMASSRCFRSW